jgi:hypothetical protein
VAETTLYVHDFGLRQQDGVVRVGDVTVRDGVASLTTSQIAFPPWLVYPESGEHYVRLQAFAPAALTEWGFIEVVADTPRRPGDPIVTSFQVRIHDGTDPLYWDGAAWSVASLEAHWNTEAEVNANLPAYTGASLAVEVRLLTGDWELTPSLFRVKLSWTGKIINTFDEVLNRGLLAGMQSGIRPVATHVVLANGTATFDLDDTPSSPAFVWTDVLAVYDYDSDPGRTTDLLSSYDSATKVVTLVSSPTSGNRLWIVARYAPLVAASTGEDSIDGQTVPAIHIIDVAWSELHSLVGGRGPWVVDKTSSPPRAVLFPQPIPMRDLLITVELLAESNATMQALLAAVDSWCRQHQLLHLPNLDLKIALVQRTPGMGQPPVGGREDLRQMQMQMALLRVPIFSDAGSGDAAGNASAIIGAVEAGDPALALPVNPVQSVLLALQQSNGPENENVVLAEE